MLRLYKNQAITNVSAEQVNVRQLELEWYTRNYETIGAQAAMFAGFAFDQMSDPVPETTSALMETLYLVLTACALGFELCVCMQCTFAVIFGQGLALRGPHGTRSMHVAVTNLAMQQRRVYAQFMLGGLAYLSSHLLKCLVFFRPLLAIMASAPLAFFFVLIIMFSIDLTAKLRVDYSDMTGQIAALGPYEQVEDLDAHVYRPLVGGGGVVGGRTGATVGQSAGQIPEALRSQMIHAQGGVPVGAE